MPIQPFIFYSALMEQLKDFGLNPNDWAIDSLSCTKKIAVNHRKDSNLKLWGEVDQYQWKYLELADSGLDF